jgi:beta-xylosidase
MWWICGTQQQKVVAIDQSINDDNRHNQGNSDVTISGQSGHPKSKLRRLKSSISLNNYSPLSSKGQDKIVEIRNKIVNYKKLNHIEIKKLISFRRKEIKELITTYNDMMTFIVETLRIEQSSEKVKEKLLDEDSKNKYLQDSNQSSSNMRSNNIRSSNTRDDMSLRQHLQNAGFADDDEEELTPPTHHT